MSQAYGKPKLEIVTSVASTLRAPQLQVGQCGSVLVDYSIEKSVSCCRAKGEGRIT